MDGGLFSGWIAAVALISFAASVVLHVLLGRRAVWGVLVTAIILPAASIALQLDGAYSSDLWSLVATMAGVGAIGGLIGASIGTWFEINVRRFVVALVG